MAAADGDKRTVCKYGDKCYQKNLQHHAKFRHLKTNEKKRRSDENCSEEESAKPPKLMKLDESKETGKVETTRNIATTSTAESENNIEETCSDVKSREYFIENEDELFEAPSNIKENIRQKYLLEMPEDFYDLWHYKNEHANFSKLLTSCNLKLVGPFDIMAGEKLSPPSQSRFLCHWRYYYDPPEFQTVLAGSQHSYHIGYFRDSPDEDPVFLASMSDVKPGHVNPVASNIFDAIRVYCQESEKTANPFKKTAFIKLAKEMENASKKYNYEVDTKTETVKQRKKKVVCKSFHGAGIVVPVDKVTEVGYREVPETDASLRKMFKQVTEAKTEEARKISFSAIQELMTNAQWANDEGDFGMSLELGMAMFINGSDYFHKCVGHLMSVAYTLLNRDQFATILKAHLKNRRTGDNLSAFIK